MLDYNLNNVFQILLLMSINFQILAI